MGVLNKSVNQSVAVIKHNTKKESLPQRFEMYEGPQAAGVSDSGNSNAKEIS